MILLFLMFLGLLGIEILKIKNLVPSEISRKMVHVLGGFFGVLLPYYFDSEEALWIGALFFLFMFLAYLKGFMKSVHDVERKTYGSFFFPLGLVAANVLFWDESFVIFQVCCLVLGVADGLVGWIKSDWIKWGVFSFITGSVFFVFGLESDIVLWKLVLGSLVLGLIEKISPYGSDNLTIPIFSGWIFAWTLYI